MHTIGGQFAIFQKENAWGLAQEINPVSHQNRGTLALACAGENCIVD